jgi:hypothetical protein
MSACIGEQRRERHDIAGPQNLELFPVSTSWTKRRD